MKVYIVVDTWENGRQAIVKVFTNQTKALNYIKKWKVIGQHLHVYCFEVEGRK